jgi:hypothetical protein
MALKEPEMSRKATIEYESLNPTLIEEAQQVLSKLSAGDHVTVSFSAELAQVMSRFLKVATEEGAIAFGRVGREITSSQTAKILGTDQVLLERRIKAGDLTYREVGGHRFFDLEEVLKLRKAEDAQNELMLEASQLMESLEPTRLHG